MLKKSLLLLMILSYKSFGFDTRLEKVQTITLYPNRSMVITNILKTPVTVYCEISLLSKDTHSISIRALSGSGLVNGTSLKKGQSLVQNVKHKELITIIASADAQADFINLGPNMVKAICSK